MPFQVELGGEGFVAVVAVVNASRRIDRVPLSGFALFGEHAVHVGVVAVARHGVGQRKNGLSLGLDLPCDIDNLEIHRKHIMGCNFRDLAHRSSAWIYRQSPVKSPDIKTL